MMTLLQVLRQADARSTAVGHFKVSNLVTLYGIVAAARPQRLPVVMGASQAEALRRRSPAGGDRQEPAEMGGPPILR